MDPDYGGLENNLKKTLENRSICGEALHFPNLMSGKWGNVSVPPMALAHKCSSSGRPGPPNIREIGDLTQNRSCTSLIPV